MLDKALRNTLHIIVTEARKILDEAARTQLQGQFGIHGNGTIEPATAMQHLSQEDRHYREQIIAISHTCMFQVLRSRMPLPN